MRETSLTRLVYGFRLIIIEKLAGRYGGTPLEAAGHRANPAASPILGPDEFKSILDRTEVSCTLLSPDYLIVDLNAPGSKYALIPFGIGNKAVAIRPAQHGLSWASSTRIRTPVRKVGPTAGSSH